MSFLHMNVHVCQSTDTRKCTGTDAVGAADSVDAGVGVSVEGSVGDTEIQRTRDKREEERHATQNFKQK